MSNPAWGIGALIAGAGFVGAVLLGLLVVGTDILDPSRMAFQLVGSGAIASALAAARIVGGKRGFVPAAAASLAVVLVVMRAGTGTAVARSAVYVLTLVASVGLALPASLRLSGGAAGRILAWGLVFAACHLAAFGLLTAAHGVPFRREAAAAAMWVGGLVGLGVGLGVYPMQRFVHAAVNPREGVANG